MTAAAAAHTPSEPGRVKRVIVWVLILLGLLVVGATVSFALLFAASHIADEESNDDGARPALPGGHPA